MYKARCFLEFEKEDIKYLMMMLKFEFIDFGNLKDILL